MRLRWGRYRGRLALAHAAHGHPQDALHHAEAAIRHLSRRGQIGELVSAYEVAAAALQELGRLDEATTAWRVAVEYSRNQAQQCSSLIGLGDLLRFLRQFDGAEIVLQQALAASARAENPVAPPLRALALNALGIVYKDTGRHHEASAAYAEAMAALTDHCGPDHTLVAAVWHNIAGLAYARGQPIEAEAAARRAVAIRERADGMAHRSVALDLAVHGAALLDLERLAEAEHCFTRAVGILSRRAPADGYEIGVNLSNLAACRARSDDNQTAARLLREAIALKSPILGARHPEVARHEEDLAAIVATRARRPSTVGAQPESRCGSLFTETLPRRRQRPVPIGLNRGAPSQGRAGGWTGPARDVRRSLVKQRVVSVARVVEIHRSRCFGLRGSRGVACVLCVMLGGLAL